MHGCMDVGVGNEFGRAGCEGCVSMCLYMKEERLSLTYIPELSTSGMGIK
jgi:hypothetical protein